MPKMLINGILRDKPVQPGGRFERVPSRLRNWIRFDPASEFPAEPDRFHLYMSKACPWCHGVDLVLSIMGLRDTISITWMDPVMSADGWVIDRAVFDPSHGVPRDRYLHEVYQRAVPDYTGAITVPVLLDRKSGRIVSTDSADIMRMLGSVFADASGPDFYPDDLRADIDRLAELIQNPVRDGVYRAGFATSQSAYCDAVMGVFDTLDTLESILGDHRYLAGDRLAEVDLKLFPTLLRFDPVYVTHFKIDRARISDYRALSRYSDDILALPGVAETINLPHIGEHYFRSHRHISPTGIIAIGPNLRTPIEASTKGVA